MIPLAVVGLILDTLLSVAFVASVAVVPSGFLIVEPAAIEPKGGTILLGPAGATVYFVSSSFFRAGLAVAILVGPEAVEAGGGVPLVASVAFVVSLFSLSCLSLSNFSFFSSTALAAALFAAGFTGSFETGLVVVPVGAGIFGAVVVPNLVAVGAISLFFSST